MRWLLLFLTLSTHAFDESYYGAVQASNFVPETSPVKWQVESPSYLIDLNEDAVKDTLKVVRKDGEVYFQITEGGKGQVMNEKIPALGAASFLNQARLITLSPKKMAIILSFYEGETRYLDYHGSARYYFVTFTKGSLADLKINKGPEFFTEVEDRAMEHYHASSYELSIEDLNKDKIKDIVIKRGLISKVFMYNEMKDSFQAL
ncbi:MAG: hypothetical protein KBD63_07270 [Bacteriovoracaceae bacterium]|nr:hypothetical protein [Bacteriovoracaceae bacterium]